MRPPLIPFASFDIGTRPTAAPEFFEKARHFSGGGIGNDQAGGIQRQLIGEALQIFEIERQQDVEPVAGRLHGLRRKPDHRRRLPAPDLRAG